VVAIVSLLVIDKSIRELHTVSQTDEERYGQEKQREEHDVDGNEKEVLDIRVCSRISEECSGHNKTSHAPENPDDNECQHLSSLVSTLPYLREIEKRSH